MIVSLKDWPPNSGQTCLRSHGTEDRETLPFQLCSDLKKNESWGSARLPCFSSSPSLEAARISLCLTRGQLWTMLRPHDCGPLVLPRPLAFHLLEGFPSSSFPKWRLPFLFQQRRTRPKCTFNYSNNKFMRAQPLPSVWGECQAFYWSWWISFHQPSKDMRASPWVFCKRQKIE